ncbi:MAG: hypothetical protein WDN06_14845 [Asticcacaulis sp.]
MKMPRNWKTSAPPKPPLAALGVGVWQYDAEADAIVEDAGMQALIGRETPGGPTLISDDDQAMADSEFTKLMAGETQAMALDIKVIGHDGVTRWITLRGQATPGPDGEREIFGVAFDCTAWKTARPAAEAAPAADIDLDAVRAEAREQALAEAKAGHESALADLQRRHETALAAAHGEATEDVYGWKSLPVPEPVIIREPDPAMAEENETLKTQLENLQADLQSARAAAGELKARLDEAATQPAPEPDYSEHEARIEALQGQLRDTETAHKEAQALLNDILSTPPLEADYSAHEARIADLQARLEQTEAAHRDTQARLDDLAATPPPEPDYSQHEARIADALADLDAARDERNGWKARYEALAAVPPPDTSELENKLSATQYDLARWQAAHRDLQGRLDHIAAQPVIDHVALEVRIDELQAALDRANTLNAKMESQLNQVSSALGNAQRFETVGRLTGDVAQDFAQMLGGDEQRARNHGPPAADAGKRPPACPKPPWPPASAANA